MKTTRLKVLWLFLLVLLTTNTLFAEPNIVITKSAYTFNCSGATYSTLLTATCYDGAGNYWPPESNWSWHWYYNGQVFAVTYGGNRTVNFQKTIGQSGNVFVELSVGLFWDESSPPIYLGNTSVMMFKTDYFCCSSEWTLHWEAFLYVDNQQVPVCNNSFTYRWWVKRYENGIPTTPLYEYVWHDAPNKSNIDGNLSPPKPTCWTWDLFTVVTLPNGSNFQSLTKRIPDAFGHFPCNITKLGSGEQPEEHFLPLEFWTQNYPNPFNPETTIKFSLPEGRFVTLRKI